MAGLQGRFNFDRFSIFFILLLLLAGVILLLFVNSLDLASGKIHDEFPSMLHSGNSVAQKPLLKLLSFLYGFVIFSLLITAVYIGGRKPQNFRGFRNVIFVYTVAYLLIYTIMMLSYWKYQSIGTSSYFLGFPAPSAWMVYAIHLFPFLLILIYLVKFHDYIISKKEIDDFLESVSKSKETE